MRDSSANRSSFCLSLPTAMESCHLLGMIALLILVLCAVTVATQAGQSCKMYIYCNVVKKQSYTCILVGTH